MGKALRERRLQREHLLRGFAGRSHAALLGLLFRKTRRPGQGSYSMAESTIRKLILRPTHPLLRDHNPCTGHRRSSRHQRDETCYPVGRRPASVRALEDSALDNNVYLPSSANNLRPNRRSVLLRASNPLLQFKPRSASRSHFHRHQTWPMPHANFPVHPILNFDRP